MVHFVFPDERYNKHKLAATYRDGVWDASHVIDNSSCGPTVNGAAMWSTYMYVNN